MKKRISRKEWTEIGQYNYAAKWLLPFCSYVLIKESDKMYKREQRVYFIAYLLMVIPVHIIQAFYCMWDGGLREFEINERYLGGDWLSPGNSAFEAAERIWSSKV